MSLAWNPSVFDDDCDPGAGSLAGRPHFELAVFEVRGAVLRLERSVREERIRVRRFDDLGRTAERGVGISVLVQRVSPAAVSTVRPRVARSQRSIAARSRLRPTRPSVSSRAVRACHQLSATIATPERRPVSSVPPSTTNAWRTPGIDLIWSTLELATLPPNTGHFSNTAYNMPGTTKSIPNMGLPVTMDAISTP